MEGKSGYKYLRAFLWHSLDLSFDFKDFIHIHVLRPFQLQKEDRCLFSFPVHGLLETTSNDKLAMLDLTFMHPANYVN